MCPLDISNGQNGRPLRKFYSVNFIGHNRQTSVLQINAFVGGHISNSCYGLPETGHFVN